MPIIDFSHLKFCLDFLTLGAEACQLIRNYLQVNHFCVPQRCLLPYSHGSSGSSIAQILSLGQSVPVYDHALWSSHCSSGVP